MTNRKFLISSWLILSIFSLKAQDITVTHLIVNDSAYFILENHSEDTTFLFSTYFDHAYRNAKIFHKITNNKKEYKISFIPLTNYCSKVNLHPDVIHLAADRIFYKYENIYSFLPINPNDSLIIDFSLITLFNDDNQGNVAYKDYDNLTIRKNDLKPIKEIKKDFDHIIFEFAVYNKNGILKNLPLDEFLIIRQIVTKNPKALHEYASSRKEKYRKPLSTDSDYELDARDLNKNKVFIRSHLN